MKFATLWTVRSAALLCALALLSCSKQSAEAPTASPPPATTAAPAASPTNASPNTPSAVQFFPSQGHQHVDDATLAAFKYNSDPPTSGPHKEAFTEVFINLKPVSKFVQAHLLEHGNVFLQYNCDCPDIAAGLAQIAYEYDRRLYASDTEPAATPQEVTVAEESGQAVIVAPYPHMKSKIALTAWTRLQTLDTVDKAAIGAFIDTYLHNVQNASQ